MGNGFWTKSKGLCRMRKTDAESERYTDNMKIASPLKTMLPTNLGFSPWSATVVDRYLQKLDGVGPSFFLPLATGEY